jgi:NAD-dependent SIR2 family protein deacetylase
VAKFHIWYQQKNERPTSNIERPTSNNVFCQFKKGKVSLLRLSGYEGRELIYTSNFDSAELVAGCGSLVIKSIKRSVINIQHSMLDVRCSTFKLCTASARWIFTQDMGYKIKPLAAEAQAA